MSSEPSVFVISDLHLGDGGPRDNFSVGDRRRQLDLFLDYVCQRQGELIVLGDLFDFWQMNLSRIVTRHLGLLDRLAAMQAVYVVGNHDADLSYFIGTGLLAPAFFQRMCGPFERKIGTRRFKFMHGHELDPVNAGDAPQWGRVLSLVAGLLEERHGSPEARDGEFLEDNLEHVGEHLLDEVSEGMGQIGRWLRLRGIRMPLERLTPAQNPQRARELRDLYRQDQEQTGYDVARVGHTHCAGRFGAWYFNTGTWARKVNRFVEIDAAGAVQLYDWNLGQPAPNDTVLAS